MKLIIVESPTKSKTIEKFLGKEYLPVATMGHIRDLPKKELGVDVEHNFEPLYQVVPGKKETIDKLKELGKRADQIYLATDPDREGEAIAYHVAYLLKLKKNCARITFHEITPGAIKKAIDNPSTINIDLVNAQQARRVLDRLVGYKLSPLLWRKIRRGLSAGRVQSVAVRLIVDREREIEKFVPVEYWDISAKLEPQGNKKKENIFFAKLQKKDDKKLEVKNEKEAKEAVSDLKGSTYSVESVEQKEMAQMPPSPFRTATLQQKASQVMGFSSKRTMRAAQSLYEKGLITYHRTDSAVLSQEALSSLREYVLKNYGKEYLPESARIYKTKSKVAQEAHEAIRPTDISKKTDDMTFSSKDEQRIYDIIWKRTLASQMKEAVWSQTKLLVSGESKNGNYQLLAEGKILKFDGWLKLYNGAVKETQINLPRVAEKDGLNLLDLLSEQKFTQPPNRYTEATLIKILEEKGIGRPSTYAPIISTIQLRQYVEKFEGKFKPSSLGMTVNDFLVQNFPDLFDYDFTAHMEGDLDEIANGKNNWVGVIREFYDPLAAKIEAVTEKAKRVQVPVEKTGEKCPECKKGELVIRVGRFGKFISCSKFPQCKYTAPFVSKLVGVKCPNCGGDVVERRTKKGKQFYGCGNWPKCKWASWRKPKVDEKK